MIFYKSKNEKLSSDTYIYYIKYQAENNSLCFTNCKSNFSLVISLPELWDINKITNYGIDIPEFNEYINQLAECFVFFKIPKYKIEKGIQDIYYFWFDTNYEKWQDGFFLFKNAYLANSGTMSNFFSLPNIWYQLTTKNIFTINPNEIHFHIDGHEVNEYIINYFIKKAEITYQIHQETFSSPENTTKHFAIILGNLMKNTDNLLNCHSLISFLNNRLGINIFTKKADILNSLKENYEFVIIIGHHKDNKIYLQNDETLALDSIDFGSDKKCITFFCCNIDLQQNINWHLSYKNISLNTRVTEASIEYFNELILDLILNERNMGLKPLVYSKKILKQEFFSLFVNLNVNWENKIRNSPILL